jgi:hypothetical protein
MFELHLMDFITPDYYPLNDGHPTNLKLVLVIEGLRLPL